MDSCYVLHDPLLVRGDNLLKLVHVGSGEVGHLGLVLDEDEGRHGGDLVLGRHVLAIINIDLKWCLKLTSYDVIML